MSFNNRYSSGMFGGLPMVTKNIIIINVILFVLTELLIKTQGIDLNDYFALHNHLAPEFKPYQFITYIFMHGSISHIFFNMFGVFMFGKVLEQTWGPKRFLIFYILTGLGAALVQYFIMNIEIQNQLLKINTEIDNFKSDLKYVSELIEIKSRLLKNSNVVGASGSLFGLLGAYGMLFPNQMLYIYFLFPVKAKWLVIAYGAIELFSGINNNPGDNVAHFAHLGGLFVGIILVLLWRKNRTEFY